jgi:alpha-ribazole phosphatase
LKKRTKKRPLVFVRHPPVSGGSGQCYGRLDLPLADPDDIQAMVGALEPLRGAVIHTSPLARCRLPAEALAEAWGQPAPYADARLMEMDFGAWEGLRWDDVPHADLDRWAEDLLGFAPPGGETGAALISRVTAFWQTLTAPAVVITHGGPLKVLLALAEGRPVDLGCPSPPTGSITAIG